MEHLTIGKLTELFIPNGIFSNVSKLLPWKVSECKGIFHVGETHKILTLLCLSANIKTYISGSIITNLSHGKFIALRSNSTSFQQGNE